jgi:uncharacterized protein
MQENEFTPHEAPVYGLHPNVRRVWTFEAILSGGFMIVLAAMLEWFLLLPQAWWPFRFGVVSAASFLLFLALPLWLVGRQYERWRYSLRSEDVVVEYGVVWRTRRSIPRLRVQHVDVNSGPVDRMLGLVHLSMYTAGSMGAAQTIPGLTPQDAEALREELLRTEAPRG